MSKYYKAFNKDLTCRGFQYEIGKEYRFDGEPILCQQGFHFCESIVDCYMYYTPSDGTRICEVEPLGEIAVDECEHKYCTNRIKIVAEVKKPYKATNIDKNSSGYFNSGYYNSGDYNSGNYNSGDYNSGHYNSGYYNVGDCNTGDINTGYRNIGNRNSGNYNTGYCNAGDYNTGNHNSGDWNSGSGHSGVFNTTAEPHIKMFNQDSDWTLSTWRMSHAYEVMSACPTTYSAFVADKHMSPEEKQCNPEHETIGGYVKIIEVTDADRQKWWDDLYEDSKQAIYALPNFDADIFKECTGIDVNKRC